MIQYSTLTDNPRYRRKQVRALWRTSSYQPCASCPLSQGAYPQDRVQTFLPPPPFSLQLYHHGLVSIALPRISSTPPQSSGPFLAMMPLIRCRGRRCNRRLEHPRVTRSSADHSCVPSSRRGQQWQVALLVRPSGETRLVEQQEDIFFLHR